MSEVWLVLRLYLKTASAACSDRRHRHQPAAHRTGLVEA